MTEWISVKDRLPEVIEKTQHSKAVLVFCRDGIFVASLIVYPASGYRKEEYRSWSEESTGCGCCSSGIEPSHWMPLPEGPEENS